MDSPKQPEDTITSEDIGSTKTPISDEHDDKFGVPSLEELGRYIGETDRSYF
jgi:cobalamin biosynthesis protein CbiG